MTYITRTAVTVAEKHHEAYRISCTPAGLACGKASLLEACLPNWGHLMAWRSHPEGLPDMVDTYLLLALLLSSLMMAWLQRVVMVLLLMVRVAEGGPV
jgi:hypothetical protein